MRKIAANLILIALIFIKASDLIAQVDPGTDHLTHWWSFDDGTANDQVQNAHGTVVGNSDVHSASAERTGASFSKLTCSPYFYPHGFK